MDQIKTLEQALKYIQVQQRENSIATRYQYELQDECERLKQMSQELAEKLEQSRNQGGTSHDSVRLVILEEKNQELDSRLSALISLLNKIQTDMGSLQSDYNSILQEHYHIRNNVADAVPADRLIPKLQDLSSHIERQDNQIRDLKIRNAQLELSDKQLMSALVEKQQLEKQLAEFQSLQSEYDNAVQLISNQGSVIAMLKAKVRQMSVEAQQYQEKIEMLEKCPQQQQTTEEAIENRRILALIRDRASIEEHLEKLDTQKKIMKELREKQLEQDLAVTLLQERLDNLEIQANRDKCMALREGSEQLSMVPIERFHVSTILKNATELFQVIQFNQKKDKEVINQYEDEIQNYRKQITEINMINQKAELEQMELQNQLQRRLNHQANGKHIMQKDIQNMMGNYEQQFFILERQAAQLHAKIDNLSHDNFDQRIQRLEEVKREVNDIVQKLSKDASNVIFEQLVERAERITFEKLIQFRLQLANSLTKLPNFNSLTIQENGLSGEVTNINSLVNFVIKYLETYELERQNLQTRLQIAESSTGSTEDHLKRLSEENKELEIKFRQAELQIKDIDILKQENEVLRLKSQELYNQLQTMLQTQKEEFQTSKENNINIQQQQETVRQPVFEFSSPRPVPIRAQNNSQGSITTLNTTDLKRADIHVSSPRKDFVAPMSTSMASPDRSGMSAMSPGTRTTQTTTSHTIQAVDEPFAINNRLTRLTQKVINGRNALEQPFNIQNSTTDRIIEMSVRPSPDQ